MRIAYCSPLPPQSSGIADYSAELLPALASQGLKPELFLSSKCRPLSQIQEAYPCHLLADLPDRVGGLDAVLYQMGNDPTYHDEIYEMALEVPGVVVLHEFMLHHLLRGLTVDRHQPEQYVALMERCYGLGGARAGRRLLDTASGKERWLYPLFEELVDASRGLIVHNQTTRDRVLSSRPSACVEVVPHHLSLEALPRDQGDIVALRQKLGLVEDEYLVGVFGFLTESKRLDVVLAAFRRLRARWPRARLILVGDATPYPDLDDLLAREGSEAVEVIGRVEMPLFLQLMQAVDTVVNLRWPTGGETSGTMVRLLGLGAPSVFSDVGSFAELPDHVAIKVPVGEGEVVALAAALLTLAENPELRQRLGANARHHVATHHSLGGSARGYGAALERMAGRPPLHGKPQRLLQHRPSSELAAFVGAALTDLGVEAGEKETLEAVSGMMLDLDLE